MHHIGILAHSADGAALCFLEMVRESARQLGEHEHPEITLSILPMAPVLNAYAEGDLVSVNRHLARSANRLYAAGCDFFVCPDNTAHIAMEVATEPYPLPGLHIADIVANAAKTGGYKDVALLGTRWTMEGPCYPAAFERAGIGMRVPDPESRGVIDQSIFGELCLGVLSNDTRQAFVKIIAQMKDEGCDAVALSCTEIPLLITPPDSPLPTLDSSRLLASAAIAVATGGLEFLTWPGGAKP
jgi:aspartate racemase